jgi:gamma-glutamylcyclotransferase (GGCT)/AIG2-like uncharacterized protein YtfP
MRPDEALLHTVFVYGTLMPGERNAHVALAAGAPLHREQASLDGYVLYHLRPEGYPALIMGEGTVQGWLLHYRAEQWEAGLHHLDELEGLDLTPPLYTRELALAQTAQEAQKAWVYLYARTERLAQPGCERVPSGDWTRVSGRQDGAAETV